MRFGWIVLLLLSFPVLEAIGIFWVARFIGSWVVLWLLLAAFAGIMLIRVERVAWRARLLFSLQSGANPLASLFASSRILLAGGLLVFPGFISDVIALVLLLIPGTWAGRKTDPLRPANDDVLEGEFKREPDDLLRLEQIHLSAGLPDFAQQVIRRRIAVFQPQFVRGACVRQLARLAQKRQQRFGQHLFRFGAIHARRPRQVERIGAAVEPVAHFQRVGVDCMVDALRTPAEQRRPRQPRQIVGVDVVGVAVVLGNQGRGAALDAFQRQAVGGIDAGRAQDAHLHPQRFAPGAQLALGVDPPHRAAVHRRHRTRLGHPVAAAIAVHAAGADVDQRPRRAVPGQRVQQMGRARIGPALIGRRRKVEHAVDARQALQRGGRVEVADVGRHAQRAQVGGALGAADHADEIGLPGIAFHQPLRHIAEPHDQDFFHCLSL